jgi:hypothetical protein
MHLVATVVIAYLVMIWLDGRSLRRDERRRQREVEGELARLEREYREPWFDP